MTHSSTEAKIKDGIFLPEPKVKQNGNVMLYSDPRSILVFSRVLKMSGSLLSLFCFRSIFSIRKSHGI